MKQFHRRKIATLLTDHKTSNLYLLLIRSRPSTEVIFQAASQEQFSDYRGKYLDLLVLDMDLVVENPYFLNRLRASFPMVKVLITYSLLNTDALPFLLKHGVDGFIEQNNVKELNSVITELLEGRVHLSAAVAREIVSSFWLTSDNQVSEREREVLSLLAKGNTYKEISLSLEISPETSKTHIRNIYSKLKVDKRDKAIRVAKEQRIIL